MKIILSHHFTIAATLAVAAMTAVPTVANAQAFFGTYNNLATFQAATTTTNSDFEGIAQAGSFALNPAVLTVAQPGRVTFTVTGGSAQNVAAIDSAFDLGRYQLSDGSDSVAAGSPGNSTSTTTIALGGSYTAFGIDYGMSNDNSNSFSFALFNGATQVGSTENVPALGGDRFFGAISSDPFTSVRVIASVSSGNGVVFDNARVGSVGAAVVPEASTLSLLLPALGMTGAIIIRRRNRQ